jgi:hypothetical protein
MGKGAGSAAVIIVAVLFIAFLFWYGRSDSVVPTPTPSPSPTPSSTPSPTATPATQRLTPNPLVVHRGQNLTVSIFYSPSRSTYNLNVWLSDLAFPAYYYGLPAYLNPPSSPIFSSGQIATSYVNGVPTGYRDFLNPAYGTAGGAAPPFIEHKSGSGSSASYSANVGAELMVKLSVRSNAPLGEWNCSFITIGSDFGSVDTIYWPVNVLA